MKQASIGRQIEILNKHRFDSQTIARHIGITEDEVNDHLDRYERALSDIEKDYMANELPKVQLAVKEMIEETSPEERLNMRARYLEEALPEAKRAFLDACIEWAKTEDKSLPHWHEEHLKELEYRLLKLGMDAKVLTGKAEGVSPERIAQARKFPISNLIKTNRGMALCPFHKEKTPSFDVRRNFFFCYGCGETGDVIDFVMKLEGLTFKQAIEKLS